MDAFLTGLKSQPKPKPKLSKDEDEGMKTVPWVEKYRPRTIDDVAHQEEVVSVLKKVLSGSDFPNLLFYGPPGTGKTSTILAAARQLFGSDLYKTRVLELNASDERGINVIREKVKTFSQVTASAFRSDGKRCPPLKLIILDEADSMTSAAQAALRRTMELHAKSTRFCLICNYVTRIIGPITSRCAKFRFKPLEGEVLKTRLTAICQSESVNLTEEALSTLLSVSEGDLRKAITFLQSANRISGADKQITDVDIAEIAGVLPDNKVEELLETCKSNSYEKVQKNVQDLMYDGYCGSQILTQIFDKIIVSDSIGDDQKAKICETVAVCEKRLLDGANEFIQIMNLCSVIMTQLTKI